MIETIKEILVIYGRIITILPLLLVTTLYMGKRSIGELPVFDFLIIITLGAVVGADLADPKIEHIHTAATVVAIGLLQRFISNLVIRKRKFGKIITFEPTIVIKDGNFLVGKLKKIRYSIDNILQMLREKDVFDISDVEMAVVEANGSLSVYKKANKSSVTIEDLGIQRKSFGVAYPVIVEGQIYSKVLSDLHLSESWLRNQLQKKGIEDINSIFFASINENHDLYFSVENEINKVDPEVFH